MMLKEFLQGKTPVYRNIFSDLKESKCLFWLQLQKYGYIFLWSIPALFSGFILALATKIGLRTFLGELMLEGAFTKIAGMVGFMAVFVYPFTKYLLVEPIAILSKNRGSPDPIAASLRITTPYLKKTFGIYIISTMLMTFITDTSVHLLLFFMVIPGGRFISLLITILSQACLYPLVYANLAVFSLMLLRHEEKVSWA